MSRISNRERDRILAATQARLQGAEALVLGCTGMVPAAAGLRAALDVPVIEPLAAAFKTAEAMVTLGLVHAHKGQYRRPDLSKLKS